MAEVVRNIRHAVRSLRNDLRFTFLTFCTLTITIGGVAIMLALVYSVLLKPLPYPEPDRLVVLQERDPRFPTLRNGAIRTLDFIDWQKQCNSFDGMALYRSSLDSVEMDEQPFRVETWTASPSLFTLLRARPVIGRGLLPGDEQPGASPAVVLSYEVWQDRFHEDPSVVGKTMLFPAEDDPRRQVAATIVGVLQPGFQAPNLVINRVSLQLGAEHSPAPPVVWKAHQPSARELQRRTSGGYTGIARLKAGVSLAAANTEIGLVEDRLAAEYPATNRGLTAGARPLLEEVSGQYSEALWILLAAVICVLLIGIGNLINLQMVRNSARERELSIRTALGASRRELVVQLMTETLVLSIAGAGAGLAVALAGLRLLLPVLPAGFPRIDQIGVNGTVVCSLFAISVVAGFLFGGIPALRVCRSDLMDILKGTAQSATPARNRVGSRQVVIALETALAFVLLAGASLLVHSWWRLISAPTGMTETNVWAVTLNFPLKYRLPADQIALSSKVLDAVRHIPEVESAGLVSVPPLLGVEVMLPNVVAEGSENPDNKGLTISLRSVTPDYFHALKVPLLRGRFFSETDTPSAQRTDMVAVINESAARILFPTADPIGKILVSPGSGLRYKVVGVIGDLKMRRLDMAPTPQLYSAYSQQPTPVSTLMVRMRKADRAAAALIRPVISALDSEVDVTISSMEEIRWQKTATERFRTALLALFAATALFLAVLGIFGVVSYAMAQRRREIGIRMAVGADSGNVIRLMIRQSMVPAAIGLISGIVAAIWLSRFLAGLLYDVAPTDFETFAAAVVLFSAAALLASFLPARRASRIDPWTTLRQE